MPGVIQVTEGQRVRIVWQPFNDKAWKEDGSKWIDGAEGIYEFLPIKKRLGDHRLDSRGRLWAHEHHHHLFGVPCVGK